MKVVWDLDGVLRDLSGHITKLHGGKYPDKWNFTFGNGKNIYDTIRDDMSILENAHPTAYCNVMKSHFSRPEIWTNQPQDWREGTTRWLNKYIGAYTLRFLTGAEKEKKLMEYDSIALIEDSPNLKSYDRIILIDRPYNQKVEHALRIFGTKHLNNLLSLIKEA